MTTLNDELDGYKPEDYLKELVNLAKLYNKDHQYSRGGLDNFDYKLKLFLMSCKKARLSKEGLLSAILIILKRAVLDFYCANQNKTVTINNICTAIQANFEEKQHKINLLQEWNGIRLQTIVNNEKNKGKKLSECFNMMIERMCLLQHGLDKGLQDDRFYYNQLIVACKGVEAC
jgi:hypothetical protein